MKNTGLNPGEEYHRVDAYSMKCRLYPNKSQAKAIDDIIHGVHAAYNMALHDMFVNLRHTNEVVDEKTGGLIHFPNIRSAAKSEYLKELREKNKYVGKVPAGALSGYNGAFLFDMNASLVAKSNTDHARPIEHSEPTYYTRKHPRKSYSNQETLGKLSFSDNRNVLYITLAKIGRVKVRGWNQKIRFGDNADQDLIEYAKSNPTQRVTVTVSKDNCGDYYIIFSFAYSKRRKVGTYAYVKNKVDNSQREIGIDVGIKDLVVCSDGTRYENKHFQKNEQPKIRILERQLARRYGWKNEEFRDLHKKNPEIMPSKRYLEVQHRLTTLYCEVRRNRSLYNNEVSKNIVDSSTLIAIESLNVKGMMKNHRLAYSLSDVAMGELLSMLKYKADWYGRQLIEIGRWEPSSKTCHCCGYKYDDLTLDIRRWKCPVCGKEHDRDLNAAINILNFAKSSMPLEIAA